MNIWFRRTNRLDGEGAVGLLDVRQAPTEGSSPRNAFGGSILGAPARQYSCDTLDLQRCRPFSAADTVVLSPVPLEPRYGPQESSPSSTRRAEQYDPRLDAWLPKLERWPRLNGTDPDGGPSGRPDQLAQSSPPSWPTNGLPAVPAQPGHDRSGDNWPGSNRPGSNLSGRDRRRALTPDATLPGGTVGGLPFGGGLPCDGPLFGSDTTLAEMPWRAAAGEAHPMTAVSAGRPVRAGRPVSGGVSREDDRSSTTTPAAAAPTATATVATTQAAAAPMTTTQATAAPVTTTQATDDSGVGEALPIFEQLRRETASGGCAAPPDIDWSSLLAPPPALETAWFAPEPTTEPGTTPSVPTTARPGATPSATATA